jgi:tetratricopeptide (TPR) repeat protein
MRVWAYRGLGLAHLLYGNGAEAAAMLGQALAVARSEQNGLEREAELLANLARAYLIQGDAVRARAAAEESVACAQRQGGRFFECMGELERARALRAERGALDSHEIEACLDNALALVAETGGRALEPQVFEERARLAALRGDDSAALEDLSRAHALYVEIGATGHAGRLARELGS